MAKQTPLLDVCKAFGRSVFKSGYPRMVARNTLEFDFVDRLGEISKVSLLDIFSQPDELRLRLGPNSFRETPVNDLIAICALVRSVRPMKLFEFGTYTGLGTIHLLLNAPPGASVTTLDLSPEDRARFFGDPDDKTVDDSVIATQFRGTDFEPHVTQIFCDSLKFDPAPFVRSMDFVFVDGCHDYEFVKNDSEKAISMLRPGGMVVWHDFNRGFPGVRRHLFELSRSHAVKWVIGTQVAYMTLPA